MKDFMGISTNYSNTQVNFGATKLDNIKLRQKVSDGTYKLVKANFYELDTKSAEDWGIMGKLCNLWKNCTTYVKDIADDFFDCDPNSRFFMNEIVDEKKGNKVTSLMQLSNSKTKPSKELHIYYLQASPDIANLKSSSPIKGSGELSLYEAVKIAKKDKCKKVVLCSTNDSFYDAMGFKKKKKGTFFTTYALTKKHFKDFLKKVEQKYDLKK